MIAESQLRALTDQEVDQISGGDNSSGAVLGATAVAVVAAFVVAGTGGAALVAIGAAVAIGAIAQKS